MSTFKHQQRVEGPFKEANPIEQLVAFYEVNGYTLIEPTDLATGDSLEAPKQIRMMRGKKGASFWSSDMTELYAELTIEASEDAVKIDYDVETTMQHFTEDDRAFWKKEASHAEKFLTGKVDQPIDWRGNESARAEQLQRDIVFLGLKLMILTMVVVFVIAVVAN